MNRRILLTSLIMLFLIMGYTAFAQVTTATIIGKVTDENGEGIEAATVVAEHTASGTQYGTTTRSDGRYSLPNLRVGGPYTITASYIGYESQTVENVYLQLAQKMNLNLVVTSSAIELEGVVVEGTRDPILNNERTGASTNIGSDIIEKLPSISRSAADFYRLTPGSDGQSFGGRNDKLNNFTLDGSIFNNPFGLDAATPGSQSGAQPVSLDAIEQIQVNNAPFDVTQSGFTGAAINAVTKSGTNTMSGTVFGFYRNQNMTGGKVSGEDIFVPDLTHAQFGFSLGGALIKDKLFFFANAEVERRGDLGSNYLANRGTGDPQESRVLASDLDAVAAALRSIGYEPGAYEGYTHRTDNQKGMFKLDWNINKNHSLTATYNFLDATKDKPAHPEALGRRGPDATTLQFENAGYAINNKVQSGIIELRSIFGNQMSNFMQVGYTAFRDARDPFSAPAPVMNINKDGIRYIVAGYEPFSVHNRLNQDVFQFTDNLTIYKGDHTFTVGTSFEKFNFDNSFNLGTLDPFSGYAGGTFGPGFESVDAFLAAVDDGTVAAAIAGAEAIFNAFGGDNGEEGVDQDPNTDGYQGWALAETNVGQWAVYAQDEWAVNDNLNLTIGLRMDKPLYFDTPTKVQENIDRQCCYDPSVVYFDPNGSTITFDQTVMPGGKPLFSPRVGFNWNPAGNENTQVRGGTGLFTGRFPFVWVGNQVANPNFWFYCMTHPDFNWPQVWRNNLGLDTKFGEGWIATVDVIYSKDIHAPIVQNFGIKSPSGTLAGVDNRPIYTAADRVTPYGNDAYVFNNTDLGYSFNTSIQLQRNWANGLYTSIAYNYLDSKDASSIQAEISSDAYARNAILNDANLPELAPSRYGNKHRIVGSAYKEFEWNDKTSTTVAIFMEYAKGGRFSYTYSGDLNGDGSGLNDLIYIPTDSELNSMNFADSGDRDAFGKFIEQDEYLSANRGSYAGKYAILSPWYSTWDLRLAQDFNTGAGNFELTLDILNVGNLINSDWGVRQLPVNTQPVGVSVADGVPTYSFDSALTSTYVDDFSLLSRWQMQLGLRYSF